MTIGLLFWIIFVLVVVIGAYWGWSAPQTWPCARLSLLLLVLLFLLGWKVFGFIIQG